MRSSVAAFASRCWPEPAASTFPISCRPSCPSGLSRSWSSCVLAASRLIKTPIFRTAGSHSAEHSGPVRKLIPAGRFDCGRRPVNHAEPGPAGYRRRDDLLRRSAPGINQTLFLNAYLVIEMIKVGLAAFVSPTFPHLRLTPFSNRQASYWYFWLLAADLHHRLHVSCSRRPSCSSVSTAADAADCGALHRWSSSLFVCAIGTHPEESRRRARAVEALEATKRRHQLRRLCQRVCRADLVGASPSSSSWRCSPFGFVVRSPVSRS